MLATEENPWLQQLCYGLSESLVLAEDEADDAFTISGKRFAIKSLLSNDAVGTVFQCSCESIVEPGRVHDVAVKIFCTKRISILTGCSEEDVVKRALHEAEILESVRGHDNIVQSYSVAVSPTSLSVYIVMQLLGHSDLFSELLLQWRQPFSEADSKMAIKQIALAIAFCHRRQIAHGDVKLENIMVATRQPLLVKLIDFGDAERTLVPDMSNISPSATSALAVRKEQNGAYPASLSDPFKRDSFGIGVIMHVLLCNSLPSAKAGLMSDPTGSKLSPNARDLILRLLNENPAKRMSAADVLHHPWLHCPSPLSLSSSLGSVHHGLEGEMHAAVSCQSVSKALQRERGATCWMLNLSGEAITRCRWMSEATTHCFQQAAHALEHVPNAKAPELKRSLIQLFQSTQDARQMARAVIDDEGEQPYSSGFDKIFATYCKLNDDMIQLIGSLLIAIQGRFKEVIVSEVRIRMLLFAAEQLGRERGFICGHVGRREELMSHRFQIRFAKILGSRQFLFGSSGSATECEVVSSSAGLLPDLRLTDTPLISSEDLRALEEAEDAALGGESSASQWFQIVTSLVDKVHQQVGMAIMLFIHDLRRRITSVAPPGLCTSIPGTQYALTSSAMPGPMNSEATVWPSVGGNGDGIISLQLSTSDSPLKIDPASSMAVPNMVKSLSETLNDMSVPEPPKPLETPNKEVVISKGTIGHPYSCRGLGCKMVGRRGCKAGESCTRCHLCVWSRGSERESRGKEIQMTL